MMLQPAQWILIAALDAAILGQCSNRAATVRERLLDGPGILRILFAALH
jgi:hypothetical protein